MTDHDPTLPPIDTVQTREELLAAVGSRTRRASVLRQAGGGPIVGLAVTAARNPDAPGTIVVDSGPRPVREATELVQSGAPLPVWVRVRPGQGWTFTGLWQPTELDLSSAGQRDARTSTHEGSGGTGPVGVLRMKPAQPDNRSQA